MLNHFLKSTLAKNYEILALTPKINFKNCIKDSKCIHGVSVLYFLHDTQFALAYFPSHSRKFFICK